MWMKYLFWVFFVFATALACSNEYFAPGYEYHYKYIVSVDGGAVGTTNRKTGFDVTCDIQILTKEQCQFILKVDRCSVSELGKPSEDGLSPTVRYTKTDQFSLELSRYPVYFSLVNGKVEHLEFHDDDSLVAKNFKRGVITSTITHIRHPSTESSDFHEIREDVQGSCDASYEFMDNDKVTMKKNMKTCKFPGKADWHYSPWSLFWNMSFIQTMWINSSAQCSYMFSSEDRRHVELRRSICWERHAIMLESTRDTEIAVQTIIEQKLTFQGASPLRNWENKNEGIYHPANIHFEYEKSSVPTKNSANGDTKVKSLLDEILMDLDKEEQDSQITTKFGELIDLLRLTPDLDKFTKEFVQCTQSKECLTAMKVHKIQIYRDALVQCHLQHCMRNVKQLVAIPEPIRSIIISDEYLYGVFDTLMKSQITDPAYVKEIKDICALQLKVKTCVLSLASLANHLWVVNNEEWNETSKLPKDVREVIDYVLKLPTTNVHDRILQLKAIGTIGYLVELHKPDAVDWLFKLDVSPLDRVARVEASRRFSPSDKLYDKLVEILENNQLSQDERAAAYRILAETWQDEDRLSTVVEQIFRSNVTDANLKFFIYSHLHSLTKSTTYVDAKFARDIIEKVTGTYWSPQLDEEATNSKYNDYNYWHEIPFLPKPMNQLGLSVESTRLHDAKDPSPFYVKDTTFLHFLGQDFEFLESSIYLLGLEQLRSYLEIADKSNWLANAAKDYLKRPSRFGVDSSELPSDVDTAIVRRLQEIRKEFTDKPKDTNPLDFLLSIRDNGDDSFFLTKDMFMEYFEDQRIKALTPRARQSFGDVPTTKYVKLVEALNLVPTLSGLPLNWTTDAYYLSKSELLSSNGNPFKWDYRVGVSASLRNRMIVDIPGYTDCGVQSLSSASLAFNGLLEVKLDPATTVSFGLPDKPAHISLARKNYLIRGYSLESIPDWDVKRVKQDWCTTAIISSLGLQICHNKSYPQVTDRPDKPWTLMAADSHWKYTVKNTKERRNIITFNFEIVKDSPDENQFRIGFVHNNLQKNGSSTSEKDILHVVHNQRTHDLKVDIGVKRSGVPYAFLQVKKFNPRFENINDLQVYGTLNVDPLAKYEANFTFHRIIDLVPAATLKNRIIKANSTKKVEVHGEDIFTTITTPAGQVYSHKYRYVKSPFQRKTDHTFNYACGVPCNTWMKDVLPSEMWDNSGNARLEYHQDRLSDQRYSFDNFQRVTTNQLITPKSLYVLKRTGEFHADVRNFLHYNISKFSLPNRVQQTFLNISMGSIKGSVDGFNVTHDLATLSVPDLTWSVQLKTKQREGQQQTYFAIMRESNRPFFGPKSLAKTDADKIGLEFDLVYKDRSAPERPRWSNYKTSCEISYPFTIGTEHITYSGELIRQDETRWNHQFDLRSTHLQSVMHSETSADKSNVLHKSTFDITPAGVEVQYNFNLTIVPSEPRSVVQIHHLFNASRYSAVHTTHPAANVVKIYQPDSYFWIKSSSVSAGKEPCDDNKKGRGGFSLSSYSPITPLANVTINAHVCDGKKYFEADLNSHFYKANLVGKLLNSGISLTADFKKDDMFRAMLVDVTTKFVYMDDHPFKPAYMEVSIPELEKKYYFTWQYYRMSMQYILTACKQKKCTDLVSDPESFIAQIIWDFYDDHYSYQTLIVNKNIYGDSEDIVNTIVKRMLSPQYTDGRLESLFNRIDFASIPANPMLDSLAIFFGPVIQYGRQLTSVDVRSVEQSTFRRSLRNSHLVWFWKYFDGVKLTRQYIFHQIEQFADASVTDTDDGLGKIFIGENTKPFSVTPDYGVPGIRSDTYRDYLEFSTIAPQRYQFKDVFFIPGYNRLAVLFSNRNAMTFDEFSVTDVQSTYKQCPFLLTSDLLLNQFAVYVQNDDLHILLPEVRIRISGTGSIYIDGSSDSQDLPFYTRNRATRVLRQENVLTVETEYNLIIKCVNGQQYCIFYTNDNTYATLTGLLGNNNNIEGDDEQPLKKWMLNKDDSCLNVPAIAEKVSNVRCSDVFGIADYYSNPVIFQAEDHLASWPFFRMCSDENTDTCSVVSAYVAVSVAYDGLDIQGAHPQCLNCNGHKIGTTWREKMEKSLELVFVVNDENDELLTADLVKSIQSLSTVISKEFQTNGFQSIKFGLMSVADHRELEHNVVGYHKEHRINGKQLYTAEEFAADRLPSIERFSHSANLSRDSDLIFDALSHASDYSFDPKVVHMVALVTDKDDEDEFKPETMQNVLEDFEEKGITLYTFSNFPSLKKHNKAVGVRGDGFVFPQPKNKELFVDYPKGQFAKLSSATRGAVWNLSNLETKSSSTKAYLQTVAEEMLARAKQDTRQCRSCACAIPTYLQPETRCHFITC